MTITAESTIDFVVSIGPLCVPGELMKNNGIKKESFIFDWCISNPRCVIDIIKNGPDWHYENNLLKRTYYDSPYEFGCLVYNHHKYEVESDFEYMKRCSQRFFKLLESDYNVIFLYVSNAYDAIREHDLKELIEVLKKKAPRLNFKIVMASYHGEGDNIVLTKDEPDFCHYDCLSPGQFHSNHMVGEYYTKLFKTVLPYNLDIKQITPALQNNELWP